MAIEQCLSNWLTSLSRPISIVVAYSGGRDSHVLLAALQHLKAEYNFKLRAIHVHHGENSADRWANHCQQVCEQAQIPLDIHYVDLALQPGDSFEDRARLERYSVFANQIHENEILVTAHTQEDQAETCLLQLLRGAGPLGLGGIASWKSIGEGYLARPLLEIPRCEIALYAAQHNLQWDEDETNNNIRLRRNFIRQRILPLLQEISPGASECIARSATHCAQTHALLRDYVEEDLRLCLQANNQLNVAALSTFSRKKRPYIFRQWLQLNQAPLPNTKKLETVLEQMLTAKEDAQPLVEWGGIQIRRYKGVLCITPYRKATNERKEISWDLSLPITLADGSCWQASRQAGRGLKLTAPILQIAFRQGGERCRPVGRRTRSLKKWLQDFSIPSWQRSHFPLFLHNGELVAVGNLFICDGWQVDASDELGWVVSPLVGTAEIC